MPILTATSKPRREFRTCLWRAIFSRISTPDQSTSQITKMCLQAQELDYKNQSTCSKMFQLQSTTPLHLFIHYKQECNNNTFSMGYKWKHSPTSSMELYLQTLPQHHTPSPLTPWDECCWPRPCSCRTVGTSGVPSVTAAWTEPTALRTMASTDRTFSAKTKTTTKTNKLIFGLLINGLPTYVIQHTMNGWLEMIRKYNFLACLQNCEKQLLEFKI